MITPEISVVMPVYNSVSTIKRAVDSILNQTYKDFEFIIINEYGSNDGSKEYIEEIMKFDDRIILIQNEKKLGIAGSLNIGIHISKGKYVARMDADDEALPDRFEIQHHFLLNNPSVSVCGTYIKMIFPYGERLIHYPAEYEDIKARSLFVCPFAHPSVMMRRDFFGKDNMYDEVECAEDYELWLRNVEHTNMTNLEEVTLNYYMDGVHASSGGDSVSSGVRLRRGYLKNRLGLETKSFDDMVIIHLYWPKHFSSCHDAVIQSCMLYKEAERANDIIKYCNTKTFRKNLDVLWTEALDMYFVKHCEGVTLKKEINWYDEGILDYLSDCIKKFEQIADSLGNVIIYGTGDICKFFMIDTPYNIEVISYCDSNGEKWGNVFLDKEVISPDAINSKHYDHILIATYDYYDDIKEKLINEYNVNTSKIESIEIIKFAPLKERMC
ncbi:MAG: glycosyltransferase family 2 protein [Lachnospiraceae bacterium]|nr:glycosyltransferase family 2 protein [Lachnospiraceae bacterium]